ncbi:MAG: Gas vesicle synthesis protein GvpL/GvpF [Actinomycetota bacterium]|jgi:hypothetical protein|nr:Gas vesicle synthesis protein GvpL/GvpF [Actinomycetota bacterium]
MWALAVVDANSAPKESIVLDDLAVVVDTTEMPSETTLEQLLRHADQVARLAAHCEAVLPVRPGTRMTEAEARTVLCDRSDEFRRALGRVRGCCEFGLRATPPSAGPQSSAEAHGHAAGDDVDGAGQIGRTYLLRKAAAWQWADGVVAAVEEFAKRDGVRETAVLATATTEVKASLLVGSERLATVRDELEELAAGIPGQVSISGPFPPYSFATLDPDGMASPSERGVPA